MHPHETDSAKSAALPLFQALGWSHENGKAWLWFRRADGKVVGTKLARAGNVETLVSIVPDLRHWSQTFPGDSRGNGVNWSRAREALVYEAMQAGEYTPPLDVRPRKPGRPAKHP